MRTHIRLTLGLLLLLLASFPVVAQREDETKADTSAKTAAQTNAANSEPFLLKRGDNEIGLWGGFSPAATTIFGGLHEDEADDRKFFLAAFRYGRTLAANNS